MRCGIGLEVFLNVKRADVVEIAVAEFGQQILAKIAHISRERRALAAAPLFRKPDLFVVVAEEHDLLCAFAAERLLHLGEKAVDLSIFDVQPDDRVVKLPLAVAAGLLDDFVALFVDTQIDSFSVG